MSLLISQIVLSSHLIIKKQKKIQETYQYQEQYWGILSNLMLFFTVYVNSVSMVILSIFCLFMCTILKMGYEEAYIYIAYKNLTEV